MDSRAGVGLAALAIAFTAGFVKYENGKLERKIDKVEANLGATFDKPEAKMDQLLFHLAGISPKSLKAASTETINRFTKVAKSQKYSSPFQQNCAYLVGSDFLLMLQVEEE